MMNYKENKMSKELTLTVKEVTREGVTSYHLIDNKGYSCGVHDTAVNAEKALQSTLINLTKGSVNPKYFGRTYSPTAPKFTGRKQFKHSSNKK